MADEADPDPIGVCVIECTYWVTETEIDGVIFPHAPRPAPGPGAPFTEIELAYSKEECDGIGALWNNAMNGVGIRCTNTFLPAGQW